MTAYLLLVLGSLVAAYILAGYPAILALWKPRRRTVSKDLGLQTSVSVVVTVFNGAAFIRAKLDSLLALDYPADLVEVIVVSDGSTDETDSIVEEYGGRHVRHIRTAHAGKAAALNSGIANVTGEIVFFTDVRQQLDPMALRHLVANFADPNVGAVTGEMRLIEGDTGEQADMDLYWQYEVWARKQQSAIDSIFNATGCVYAMRRSLVGPIPADTLTDDAILPLRAFFQGYRVVLDEEAIAYDHPAVSGTEFRRRVRTLAGLWQVHIRMPRLFTSANRMRFHFLSHKFARLVLPWAILVVLGATAALPPSLFKISLVDAELALLATAILDRFVPENWTVKRLTSLARTFCLMNLAALISISVFFVRPARFWVPTRVAASTRQSSGAGTQ